MATRLPDEIISEILSPALKVPDELFSDTSHVSPFAAYTPSTSAYLLVCKDWLRVATPLLFNVVVLRSQAQASALDAVLRHNKAFGLFIKKLRVEGGYGMAMHTILKSAPNITDLFLSLSIYSSDNTQGLCKGLPLINPRQVIVVDPHAYNPLKNKSLAALTKTLLSCVKIWDHLEVFNFPYGPEDDTPDLANERALDLAKALTQSQSLHSVWLSSYYFEFGSIPQFINILRKNPSLRTIRFQHPFEDWSLTPAAIESDPQLKLLVQYPVVKTESIADEPRPSHEIAAPDIIPSLNPFFIPMGSASEETREMVWKRVLFFAMYVEELRSPSFPRRPTDTHPSRLPILLVSKCFHRLGLPYLYDSLNVTGIAAPLIAKQLEGRPDLGSFIRVIFLPLPTYLSPVPEDALHLILSHATHVESFPSRSLHDASWLSARNFELLARKTGSTLREFTGCLRWSTTMSISIFRHFPELRVLKLTQCSPVFTSYEESVPENALGQLHTLLVHNSGFNGSLFQGLSLMRLESLHTLLLPTFTDFYGPHFVTFMKVHGTRLLHLTTGRFGDFKFLDACNNLVDVKFHGICSLECFACDMPHRSLTKITANALTIESEKIDFDMFPALREIQIINLRWPTTERDISKNSMVPFAEYLLEKNIKLLDGAGKHWIPRLKNARARKR
ncbi:F-box domain-containing protein [Mycena sanguinolenta]|uniref:F-box domain-containing protein n=1 Tax=Mycena sanguinolenta TaxID=230812 RepID=A0A8H6Y1N3_9AGAR|nr:F-box domain-containing protein [Mycena sanguinolenta]